MDMTAERVARNDSTFRDANERISATASDVGFVEPVPFICECASPTCNEIVRLSLADYEDVRSHPTRFLIAPGHAAAEQNSSKVVDSGPEHAVVEKLGIAAEVARSLDPRGGKEASDR
jgi:hypothetical protein